MSEGRWERSVGLADHHGSVVELTFDPADEMEEYPASGSFLMRSGAARISATGTTPEAMRQLSAAALDLADKMEEARE